MSLDEPIDMVDFKIKKATGLTQEQLFEVRHIAKVATRLMWCSVVLFVGIAATFLYWVL